MDINDTDQLELLISQQKPDVIIHLAAQAGVRASIHQPFSYADSNLRGHLSMLEACRRSRAAPRILYASSSSVYGDSPRVPFSEDDPCDSPVSLYAATKRSNELTSQAYARLYGIEQIGLRFFTVYGSWGRPDMAYWLFTEKLLADKEIILFNQGLMKRDLTHISDVVSALSKLSEKQSFADECQTPHRIFNVGNGKQRDLGDLVAAIESSTSKKANVRYDSMQMGDVKQTHANISALQKFIDYRPATDLRAGIAEFVNWFAAYQRRRAII